MIPTQIRRQRRIKKPTFRSIEYVLERSETPNVPQVVPTKQSIEAVQMYHAARGSLPFTAIGYVRVHGASSEYTWSEGTENIKQRDFNIEVNPLQCLREKKIAVFTHGSDKDRTCLESHSRDIFW